ncbi:alpha/beta fold hydrolase [Paraburkholderia humisilvae]|uniref:2-hydroxy-6-oxononadienedioate/2-hydroxy-6-oxononatrienedioate hydrolase n=1 Tax=Paraburkholderia humisilvae TaxID=627669 RepID=A0A6J5CUX6_9BURK|nr:alpha/beta fold hydrolase [Paraburkholderia humisilvae]CAB3745930.1 2-hydroxy-6-oxononadienedioate/2-hydroxy-6-oxononatrienedioate hydrolase [Paraburkholderia humisilvae]
MSDLISLPASTLNEGRAAVARLDGLATHHRYRLASTGGYVMWRVFGDSNARPLVLVHGGHGNWMHWVRNIEPLTALRAVWVPDLPGYGDSDALPDGARFEDLMTATLDSLNALVGASTEIDLTAFSFGGVVAATLACRRPVGQLALVGSAGHGGKRRLQRELLNWKKIDVEDERRALFDANLKSFMLHDPATADSLALTVYEQACLKTRFRSKDVSLMDNLAALLKQANVDTLLLWGTHDVTADEPQRFSDRLHTDGVRHAFGMVENAGHWAQYEAADEVNRRLSGFFAKA